MKRNNKKTSLKDLPYGALIVYRGKRYFKSKGLDDDIVTTTDGVWFFIKELNWKTFQFH